MGALTSNNYSYELRSWEIDSLSCIDPTDGFGTNTRVYITNAKVILIEPDYDINTTNIWLSDKGRLFFDGFFQEHSVLQDDSNIINRIEWGTLFKRLTEQVYVLDYFNALAADKDHSFLTIIFQSLEIESISLLMNIDKSCSFVKVRKIENDKVNNDIESNMQLSLQPSFNRSKSFTSRWKPQLGLLIATDPRYEGYYLNLALRQNYLKGDFKCLVIGSLIDLSFPITFIGSSLITMQRVLEGRSIISSDLVWSSEFPIIICNNELLKRNDGKYISYMLNSIKNCRKAAFQIIDGLWNKLNLLSPSLYHTGTHLLSFFLPVLEKDLRSFNSLYFINTTTPQNIPEWNRVVELRLSLSDTVEYLYSEQQAIAQQLVIISKEANSTIYSAEYKPARDFDLIKLVTSHFFENDQTFYNTEGFVKRSHNLIKSKSNKSSTWQMLRLLEKRIKNVPFLDKKNKNILTFNSKKTTSIKNFINFQYLATHVLTFLGHRIINCNNPFSFDSRFHRFRQHSIKVYITKLRWWLDDFFLGGLDGYSQSSDIMARCSNNFRIHTTNFF